MDTSDSAIGACLSQEHKDSKLRLVVYYLKKITLLKLNYNVYNKELLTIVEAF